MNEKQEKAVREAVEILEEAGIRGSALGFPEESAVWSLNKSLEVLEYNRRMEKNKLVAEYIDVSCDEQIRPDEVTESEIEQYDAVRELFERHLGLKKEKRVISYEDRANADKSVKWQTARSSCSEKKLTFFYSLGSWKYTLEGEVGTYNYRSDDLTKLDSIYFPLKEVD